MSDRTSFESMSEDLVGSGLQQLISSNDVIFKNRQELFSISPIGTETRRFSPSSSETKSSYDPWSQPFGSFLGASPISKLPSASHSLDNGHSPLKPSLVYPLPPPTTPPHVVPTPTSTPPSTNTFPAPSIDALSENLSKFTLGKSGHHTDGWIEEWLFGMGGMDGVEAQPVVGLLRRASKDSPQPDPVHQSRLKAYQQTGSVSPLTTPVITMPPLTKSSTPNSPEPQRRSLSNPPQPLSFPLPTVQTTGTSTPTLLSPVSLTANGNTSFQQISTPSSPSQQSAPPHHHHSQQSQQSSAPHHHSSHHGGGSSHSRSQRSQRHQQQQYQPTTTLSPHSSQPSLSYQKRSQQQSSSDQVGSERSSMNSSSGSVTSESRNLSPMTSPTIASPTVMSPRSYQSSLNSSLGDSPSNTDRRHQYPQQFSQQQFTQQQFSQQYSHSNSRNNRAPSTGSGSSYSESTGRDYMDIPSNGSHTASTSNNKYYQQSKNGDSFKENRSIGSSHGSHSSQSSSLQDGSYYGSSEDELSAGSYSHGSQSEGYSPSQFKAGQLKAGNKYRGWSNSKKEFDLSRFELDIAKVLSGEEKRTTLMVKNIPNKYTQEMLLDTISERHKGLYDFFYLPIDFKNKCNVGYSFINFIDPLSIPEFYLEFNQKRWSKFNSSKVCKITYARIQGKSAFIEHFRNSSLMNEEIKCRPLIFYGSGPQQGLPEPFPDPRSIAPSTNTSYAPERRPTNDVESETPYADEENYNYVNI